MENKLSVIIITKNEEENISRCLESLFFADEIIILDSGSQDKTLDIARKFSCRIYEEEWKGFGPQKQSALEKTSYRWVLSIDADEVVPPQTAQVIKEILKDPLYKAYSFPRKNIFHGRWIKGCGWWPNKVIRLFHKDYGKFEGLVHESWKTQEKIGYLEAPLEHYPFNNYADILEKMNIYSSLAAQEMYKKGKKVTFFTPFLHAFWMFFRSFFLQKGFLYGWDGIIISLLNAYGRFFRYAKLLELYKFKF